MHTDVVRQGRLRGDRDALIEDLLSSIQADREIAEADVQVDIAHLLMLVQCGILKTDHASPLVRELLLYYRDGVPKEAFHPRFEDIHAGIESLLIEKVGMDIGGRMHAGRSRNDEVATCLRIRTREILLDQIEALIDLRSVLIDTASEHVHTIMPGFTHLQHAQPTTLAHYLLAYEEVFSRDGERLYQAFLRTNRSPLGAAAFASTGFPIDREYTARLLGFESISCNTMDAVASRDFAAESLAAATILMTHVSRLCEELVIWSTSFVRFVDLDDRYCSTSSIMPQKKNPDVAEILRSRAGSVLGALVSAVSIEKSLPLSYNRDLQELSPHLFREIKPICRDIRLVSGMIASATFQTDRMREEAKRGFSTATDLADHLVVNYGLAFRAAHNIVGRAIRSGKLSLEALDEASCQFINQKLSEQGLSNDELSRVLEVNQSIAARRHPGGPAPAAVLDAVTHQKSMIIKDTAMVQEQKERIMRAKEELMSTAERMIGS